MTSSDLAKSVEDLHDACFPVVEKFVSINGEGLAAGQLAAFIRFAGCNLSCSYCDTAWANDPLVKFEACSARDLVDWVREARVAAVTLTGGEPLLQPHLIELVRALADVREPNPLRIEIESNGACDVRPLLLARDEAQEAGAQGSVHVTLDWKTPSAGRAVSATMLRENYALLDERDAVKFVIGSLEDVAFAQKYIQEAQLEGRCGVLLSPVWGAIEPAEIIDAMKEHRMAFARLQLQLHKIIWPHVDKGV